MARPEPIRDDNVPHVKVGDHVRRLKANEKFRGVLCGEVQGYWCHWDDRARRTLPCTKPIEECAGHQLQLPSKWKGYYSVLNLETRQQEFIEVTNTMALQITWHLRDRGAARGYVLNIARGKSNHARCKVFLEERYMTDTTLPKERLVKETLYKLWGMSHLLEKDSRDDVIPGEIL